MQCLLYLGSGNYHMYYEDRWEGDPMNTIMKRCRDMDLTLSNAVGEVTLVHTSTH